MKLSVKFFIWLIEIKVKKLNAEDKIKFLLNELVKTIQNDGHMEARTDGFASASIYIHNANKPNAQINIEGLVEGWSYKGKPTFKVKQEVNK